MTATRGKSFSVVSKDKTWQRTVTIQNRFRIVYFIDRKIPVISTSILRILLMNQLAKTDFTFKNKNKLFYNKLITYV